MSTATVIHDNQTLERDLQIIITTDAGLPTLTELDLETKLDDIDFNVEKLLIRLGLDIEKRDDPEEMSFGDILELTQSKPEVHQKLGEIATEATINRLLKGMLMLQQQAEPGETQRWWYELVRQVLWWYARQSSAQGLKLIRQDAPGKALQSLIGLGLVEIDILARDKSENAVTFIDILERLKYPNKEAVEVYQTLSKIAKKIVQDYDGRVQEFLRGYSNQMVDMIEQSLLGDASSADFLKEAIRGWISTTTTLPIFVWSPSTIDFVHKFSDDGVSEETLMKISDETGLDPSTVNRALSEFMERLCRNCDPENMSHQNCIKQFAGMGLQMICPANREGLF